MSYGDTLYRLENMSVGPSQNNRSWGANPFSATRQAAEDRMFEQFSHMGLNDRDSRGRSWGGRRRSQRKSYNKLRRSRQKTRRY